MILFQEIFITHAIPNHFGGAHDVIQLHKKHGLEPPNVYKKLDGNQYELEVIKRFPNLKRYLFNITEDDVFFIPINDFEEDIARNNNMYHSEVIH